MLDQYWANVVDGGPILVRYWIDVSCSLGAVHSPTVRGSTASDVHPRAISCSRADALARWCARNRHQCQQQNTGQGQQHLKKNPLVIVVNY